MRLLRHGLCVALLPLPLAAWAQSTLPADAALESPGAPRWEAGLAAGAGRVADYPGSDQSHLRGAVLPVLVYRGPVLRVDQGGIRGRFLSTPQWEFELSATAAFNARNNDARRGMPALDYLAGIGPQWVYKGWQQHGSGATLHLKARALMSSDFKRIDQRGVSFDPELRWRFTPAWARSNELSLSVQPTWASRALQRYFYEVTPAQATATRPAYSARAGYLGTQLAATWHGRPTPSLSWFVTAQFMSLRGAANEGSPLLRDRSNASVGAGLVWTPWRSGERVID